MYAKKKYFIAIKMDRSYVPKIMIKSKELLVFRSQIVYVVVTCTGEWVGTE